MTRTVLPLGLLLACITLAACGASPRIEDPTLIPNLRGYIRPEKNEYLEGEKVIVQYWIINVGEEPHEEMVMDGSHEITQAFHGYTFNATLTGNPDIPMQLDTAGPPVHGPLKLAPKEEQLFCSNTFIAKQMGEYQLTFELRWRDSKKIGFSPEIVRVRSLEFVEKQNIPLELEEALKKLGDPDELVRIEARETVLKYKNEVIFPPLVDLFASENMEARKEASQIFVLLQADSVSTLLIAATHHDPTVRIWSLITLGRIGIAANREALKTMQQALLYDKNSAVRLAALDVVAQSLHPEFAIPCFIETMKDTDLEVRKIAWQFLLQQREVIVRDESHSFVPESSSWERQGVINRWKEWWEEDHPGYRWAK